MTPERAANRDRFWSLVARFNQLGCMLPDDLDLDDLEAMAEAQIIIAEMNATRAEMNLVLDDEKARRRSCGDSWP